MLQYVFPLERLRRENMCNTSWYWHFVLRNHSAQNRKSLWKITTLTFWGGIDLEHLLSFVCVHVCVLQKLKRQTKAEIFPVTHNLHTMSWGLWHSIRSRSSIEEQQKSTWHTMTHTQCVYFLFTIVMTMPSTEIIGTTGATESGCYTEYDLFIYYWLQDRVESLKS